MDRPGHRTMTIRDPAPCVQVLALLDDLQKLWRVGPRINYNWGKAFGVSAEKGQPEKGRLAMKRAAIVFVVIAIGTLFTVAFGCVSTNPPYPTTAVMEKITGIWQNTEYNGAKRPAKRVIDPDGLLEIYDNTYDESHVEAAQLTVTKAWADESNRIWFKSTVQYDSGDLIYELARLELDKMDISILWSSDGYPKKWDPVTYPSYFYRK